MPEARAMALVETRLLLEALRLGQTAERWLTQCDQAGVQWDNLAVRAIVLGLAPQLNHKLVEWDLGLQSRRAPPPSWP